MDSHCSLSTSLSTTSSQRIQVPSPSPSIDSLCTVERTTTFKASLILPLTITKQTILPRIINLYYDFIHQVNHYMGFNIFFIYSMFTLYLLFVDLIIRNYILREISRMELLQHFLELIIVRAGSTFFSSRLDTLNFKCIYFKIRSVGTFIYDPQHDGAAMLSHSYFLLTKLLYIYRYGDLKILSK